MPIEKQKNFSSEFPKLKKAVLDADEELAWDLTNRESEWRRSCQYLDIIICSTLSYNEDIESIPPSYINKSKNWTKIHIFNQKNN